MILMNTYNYHDFLAFLGIGGAHPGGLGLTKKLLEDVEINQDSRILDAGCGMGQTAAYLATTYGCHVTAVDYHPIMIEKARQRFHNENVAVELIQGNIEKIPLASASFDLILVESVTVFTEIVKTVAEFARLLVDNGILFDLEMTAALPFSEKEILAFQQVYDINQVPTEIEWKYIYKNGGFHSVETFHGDYVANALTGNYPQTFMPPEFDPSDVIDPSIYQIWDEHQQLTEKYADMLKYSVYYATKQ